MHTRLLLALVLALPFAAKAQTQPHPCGTPPRHTDWFKDYMRHRADFRTGADTMLHIPLAIHLVGTDAGNAHLSPMKLLDGFCVLNDDFANSNAQMHFYIESINYIDSTAWYSHPSVIIGYDMMVQNNHPNAINTYIVANPAGNAGYNLPSADGLAVGKTYVNTNNHTWAHEIGHNLSVQHPFLGWEGKIYSYTDTTPTRVTYDYTLFKDSLITDTTIIDTAWVELVDGSNCAFAADGICDTGPDYLSFGGWQCNSMGQSTILQRDPNFVDFRSDATNIMTYSNDACGATFTAGQIAAMRANLLTEKATYLHSAPSIDTIDTDVTLYAPTFNSLQDLRLYWSNVPNATHYVVQVSILPSFTLLHDEFITTDTTASLSGLLMDRNYYWRVRPFNYGYACTNTTAGTFDTYNVSPTTEVAAGLTLQLSPNPVTAQQPLTLALRTQAPTQATVRLVSSSGQLLWSRVMDFHSGDQNVTLPTSDLPAGTYILAIQTPQGIVHRRFVVL